MKTTKNTTLAPRWAQQLGSGLQGSGSAFCLLSFDMRLSQDLR
jgi:hypothetical protein